jgi:primosomal protein N''
LLRLELDVRASLAYVADHASQQTPGLYTQIRASEPRRCRCRSRIGKKERRGFTSTSFSSSREEGDVAAAV